MLETKELLKMKTEHESCLVNCALGINTARCNTNSMARYTDTVQSGLIGSDINIHEHCFTAYACHAYM